MWEYIAGVRVICGRKMQEWEIMCGVKVSQVKPSNCFRHVKKIVFPSIFDTLLSFYTM